MHGKVSDLIETEENEWAQAMKLIKASSLFSIFSFILVRTVTLLARLPRSYP